MSADAWTLFETLRWGSGPQHCPHCGEQGRCVRLPAAGLPRRVWRCTACRQQFSVLTGTVLEHSRLPPARWLGLTRTLVSEPRVSARELARRHDVTPATARHVVARLRAAGVPAGGVPLGGLPVDGDAEAALRAVLRLPPEVVRRVRAATPTRRGRPEPGPRADYE